MSGNGLIQRLARGAAAGFVGTIALQGVRMATQKWLPEAMPPIRKDPGEFMVEQVEQSLPPETSERVPAATHFGRMTPMGMLIGHLVYGIVLGLTYQTWPLG